VLKGAEQDEIVRAIQAVAAGEAIVMARDAGLGRSGPGVPGPG
jgi:hypothetical protein